jgi:hypothetical protein
MSEKDELDRLYAGSRAPSNSRFLYTAAILTFYRRDNK